ERYLGGSAPLPADWGGCATRKETGSETVTDGQPGPGAPVRAGETIRTRVARQRITQSPADRAARRYGKGDELLARAARPALTGRKNGDDPRSHCRTPALFAPRTGG